jgi:hypothetical protein
MSDSDIFYPYQMNLFQLDKWQVMSWIKNVPEQYPIILFTIEPVAEEYLLSIYQAVAQAKGQRSVIWVLNESIGYSHHLEQVMGKDLVRLDFDLMIHHIHMDVSAVCATNQTWNPTTGRFLFLTGKPDRANRLALLYKFYQATLLDHCDWSLHIENQATDLKCRQMLSFLSDLEYREFVQKHARNPDNILGIINKNDVKSELHYSGYPFDSMLYKNTSFRVIAETQMSGVPVTSEKTWLTIANSHPFIMAGYQHNLTPLKQRGFKTFEQYLPVPEYDEISDDNERFKAVVENTRYWVDSIHKHKEEIGQDLIHNRDLLQHCIDQTVSTARALYNRINYHDIPWTRLLPWFTIEQTRWMLFYYRVRDKSWPECYCSANFGQLPQHIQQECIEQFGYNGENY